MNERCGTFAPLWVKPLCGKRGTKMRKQMLTFAVASAMALGLGVVYPQNAGAA